MAAHPGLHLLVAEVDGQVVGTLAIAVIPNITHSGRPWAQIENVVVLDKFRRRGVGQALIDHCAEITRAAGGYKMQLISSDVRREAHAFYLTAGFEDEFRGFRTYF
jgi:GNAT superfamily N-acetyltransferase